jgi:hypothetical protein
MNLYWENKENQEKAILSLLEKAKKADNKDKGPIAT